jgi:hypothetical protein
MKKYGGGVEVYRHASLTSALDVREWSVSAALPLRKAPLIPIG